jgi:hypothetical protein
LKIHPEPRRKPKAPAVAAVKALAPDALDTPPAWLQQVMLEEQMRGRAPSRPGWMTIARASENRR